MIQTFGSNDEASPVLKPWMALRISIQQHRRLNEIKWIILLLNVRFNQTFKDKNIFLFNFKHYQEKDIEHKENKELTVLRVPFIGTNFESWEINLERSLKIQSSKSTVLPLPVGAETTMFASEWKQTGKHSL